MMSWKADAGIEIYYIKDRLFGVGWVEEGQRRISETKIFFQKFKKKTWLSINRLYIEQHAQGSAETDVLHRGRSPHRPNLKRCDLEGRANGQPTRGVQRSRTTASKHWRIGHPVLFPISKTR